MTVAAGLPPDLQEATILAEELDINYGRLKMWWQLRKIRPYKRGNGRILLSRSEVERYKAFQDHIVPLDGNE